VILSTLRGDKMLKTNNKSKAFQFLTVIVGALLMGFLWRVRGTHGWGSSWGLLNAGFIFTMFVVLFKGERKKLNFGWLALTSLMFMLTVPAWGTLLDQITGVLFNASEIKSLIPFNSAYASDVYCSVPSAVYIMLTLGFGLASLYGIMLGRAYSDKQWKAVHYVILLAVFFVSGLVAKATVSHLIIDFIQPQAGEAFEVGLKDYMLTLAPFESRTFEELRQSLAPSAAEIFEANIKEYLIALVPADSIEALNQSIGAQGIEGISFEELKSAVMPLLSAESAEEIKGALNTYMPIEAFKLSQNLQGISFDELKTIIAQSLPADAVEAFESTVSKKSIEGSAWQVYLKHFDDVSWAKKVVPAGSIGRNYFQTVEMISLAISAVASLIATRFIIKDKCAANTGFVVCGAFAFAITVSDLFFYFGDGGYHQLAENYFGERVAPWSCWEYFTGFIAGGIITAYMLRLKPREDVEDIAFSKVPEKVNKILTFILSFGFLVGVSIVRPVLERFDESKNQILYVIISVVLALALVAVLAKKWGIDGKKAGMAKICATLLPLFIVLIFMSYVFVCSPEYSNVSGLGMFHNIMCLISVPIVLIWSLIRGKKLLSQK